MQELTQWLSDFDGSHQNPLNQRISKVAVPGAFLGAVGLIWTIPSPALFGFTVNWVWMALVPIMVFYLKLSVSIFLMMLGFTIACISLIWSLDILQLPVFSISAALFILLEVVQLIGYKLEGKSPSLTDKLWFILIGPIWVFHQK
ncbi:hypothetical protein GCM10007938_25440 [Vibrio zhanjiangensis]|uniref:DUF962 domain-containing protein n=1 Tax=Vibrio zhanjiangensis TaxID=1046128 RepID=A0ABQ6EZV2_9VIBR|nr:Mpo1-like protein [Vibrio zhanjiangensis]GLT18763.1 hypothetical protein GCM10007938_25440 [Vibrio zhanjiangensis]